MCGIVGATSSRNVTPILVEGLRRLEYRGYDSAGVAILSDEKLQRCRVMGKVQGLADALQQSPLNGHLGIAHTRWATHGVPSEQNAHPHISHNIALVHNGIIENYAELREELRKAGYEFTSQTDTEVIAHLVHFYFKQTSDLLVAVQNAVARLHGAYGLAILHADFPDRLVAVRSGSPLVIGLGENENFVASDPLALLPVTRNFIYLKEGDIVDVYNNHVDIYDAQGFSVTRDIKTLDIKDDAANKGEFAHFMQKEIFEQAEAVNATLEGRILHERLLDGIFGEKAKVIFKTIKHVQIIACGTSYHAGLVARYWLEEIAHVACNVEIASEFRYRKHVVPENSLLVCISQSGETADTLAALRQSKTMGYLASLAICNAPESSLVRESDIVFMTRAGREIGVASTKAFTTQLVALLLFTLTLAKLHDSHALVEHTVVTELEKLPHLIQEALMLDKKIKDLADFFNDKTSALFLGRGTSFPVALEGALKLKEISYIHAEGYAAGELKHGPIALIDKNMPVIVVAPNDQWLEKLKSNIEEVRSRGGIVIVFTDKNSGIQEEPGVTVLHVPYIESVLTPIMYSIPLQLLSYHVAVARGTDVDQPRNLAKSVTVE
ncbi:MAG: glutamine--fructose-6-phosphate transaminase (isomerizing) [Pseudomonadota bacterium]